MSPPIDRDLSDFYSKAGEQFDALFEPYLEWLEMARPAGYELYQEPMLAAPGPRTRILTQYDSQEHELVNLSSYNYLGLAHADIVIDAARKALEKYGLGSSGGPILSGTFDIHRQLERELAAVKGKAAASIFSSGYAANIGIISAIMRPGDQIFLDQYAHASLVDGAVLSKAHTIFFRHNSAADLAKKMSRASDGGARGRRLIVIEGVYSMDGDLCALPDIVAVSQKERASILIDEAHSAFVCGDKGRGVAEYFGLEDAVDFHMGTFSKALGGIGGYACGSQAFVSYIEAYARSRFFSCTLPPAVAAGVLAGLRHATSDGSLRRRLWDNVHYLQRRFREEGVDFGKSNSQILPIMINNDEKAFTIAKKLRRLGYYIQAVTYPAVPRGKSRLRWSTTAVHSIDDLEMAIQALVLVLKEEGLL